MFIYKISRFYSQLWSSLVSPPFNTEVTQLARHDKALPRARVRVDADIDTCDTYDTCRSTLGG